MHDMEPTDMLTTSVTPLIVIRWLSNSIFVTSSMFSSVVDMVERPGWISSLVLSRPAKKVLYLLWILCAQNLFAKCHKQHFKYVGTLNFIFNAKIKALQTDYYMVSHLRRLLLHAFHSTSFQNGWSVVLDLLYPCYIHCQNTARKDYFYCAERVPNILDASKNDTCFEKLFHDQMMQSGEYIVF